MILEMLNVLEDIYENEMGKSHIYKYCDVLQEGKRSKKYKPLFTRDKCSKFHLMSFVVKNRVHKC